MGKINDFIKLVSRSLFLKSEYKVNFKFSFDLWGVFVTYIIILVGYLFIGAVIGYNASLNFCLGMFGVVFAFVGAVWFFADRDVIFASDIKKSTLYLAQNNGLIIKENQVYNSHNLKGEKVRKEKEVLLYAPEIKFKFDDERLIWIIRKDGHKLSRNYGEFGELLQGLFKMVLENVTYDHKLGSYIYVFRRKDLKRSNVSEALSVEYIVRDKIALNDEYIWNFRLCPHGLFTGITGSGKTYFFAYLIVMFLKIKASFRIIDPKRADLYYLKKYFGEDEVVHTKGKALKILREAGELIDFRMDEFQKREDYSWGKDYSYYKVNPYFVIFDEAAAFVCLLNKKEKEEYDEHISKIILEGRQAGVFILFAMQRADAGEFIKGALRDQLGLRIVLSRASTDGYKMVFGSLGKDLELIDKEAGFYMDLKMDYPKEFYTPYLDIDFIEELESLINYKEKVVLDDKEIN